MRPGESAEGILPRSRRRTSRFSLNARFNWGILLFGEGLRTPSSSGRRGPFLLRITWRHGSLPRIKWAAAGALGIPEEPPGQDEPPLGGGVSPPDRRLGAAQHRGRSW